MVALIGNIEPTTLTEKAMQFAIEAHGNQFDKSGKPYIMHPVAVASIIACIVDNDENLICAAFLHDTLEDTDTTYQDLIRNFNLDIANLVREVTKKKVDGRKTFPWLSSQRGYTLKFADMTHNASRMGDQPKAWQKKWIEKIKYWLPKTALT